MAAKDDTSKLVTETVILNNNTWVTEATDGRRTWVKQSFWMPKEWLNKHMCIYREDDQWTAIMDPFFDNYHQPFETKGGSIQHAVTALDEALQKANDQ